MVSLDVTRCLSYYFHCILCLNLYNKIWPPVMICKIITNYIRRSHITSGYIKILVIFQVILYYGYCLIQHQILSCKISSNISNDNFPCLTMSNHSELHHIKKTSYIITLNQIIPYYITSLSSFHVLPYYIRPSSSRHMNSNDIISFHIDLYHIIWLFIIIWASFDNLSYRSKS